MKNQEDDNTMEIDTSWNEDFELHLSDSSGDRSAEDNDVPFNDNKIEVNSLEAKNNVISDEVILPYLNSVNNNVVDKNKNLLGDTSNNIPGNEMKYSIFEEIVNNSDNRQDTNTIESHINYIKIGDNHKNLFEENNNMDCSKFDEGVDDKINFRVDKLFCLNSYDKTNYIKRKYQLRKPTKSVGKNQSTILHFFKDSNCAPIEAREIFQLSETVEISNQVPISDIFVNSRKLIRQLLTAKVVLERLPEHIISKYVVPEKIASKKPKEITRICNFYCVNCKIKTHFEGIECPLLTEKCSNCNESLFYQCVKCNKNYLQLRGFYLHVRKSCWTNLKYCCEICLFTTAHKVRIKKHLQMHHSKSNSKYKLLDFEDCDILKETKENSIPKVFEDRKNIPKAFCKKCKTKKVIRDNFKFCDSCQSRLLFRCVPCHSSYSKNLTRCHHLRQLFKNSTHHCSVCNKAFFHLKNLKAHSLVCKENVYYSRIMNANQIDDSFSKFEQ